MKTSDSGSSDSDKPDTPQAPRSYHYFNNKPECIIDLVLVSKHSTNLKHNEAKEELKKQFHQQLCSTGLAIELTVSDDGRHLYTLIHVPRALMRDQAEAMHFKVPLKRGNTQTSESQREKYHAGVCVKCSNTFARLNPLKLDKKYLPFTENPRQYLVEYSKQRAKNYVSDSKESFFRPTQRIKAAWDLLYRIRLQKPEGLASSVNEDVNLRRIESEIKRTFKQSKDIGFDKLIQMGVFDCVYPLHDGPFSAPPKKSNPMEWNTRAILGTIWCRMSIFLKEQPLWTVSEYFGKKIALYFTWLEFYTKQLMYLSAIGIGVAIFGYIQFDRDIPSQQICDVNQFGNLTMCPECEPPYCSTYKLVDNCQMAKHTHAFENDLVPIWGLILSCWSIMFLELWTRKKAKITDAWGTMEVSKEEKMMRANYKFHAKKKNKVKKNRVTRITEPYIDRWVKLYRRTISWFIVILCVMIMISFEFILSLLRTQLVHEFHRIGLHKYMKRIVFADIRLLAGLIASLINLTVSLIFERFYRKLTASLTEFDLYRTDEAFENNYVYKIILFQYVNYFTPIYYIAFVKNSVISNPGDIKGFVEKGCALSNCEIEVVIQYVIIMIGRQMFTSLTQIMRPWCTRKVYRDTVKSQRHSTSRKTPIVAGSEQSPFKQYAADRLLAVPAKMPLVNEYMELVIQYGFVVLSVSFPPAAFFALLNNALEIRIDAGKLVKQTRRPIPETVNSIGAWYSIMKWTAKVGVLANAFYIAFATDIIPRWFFSVQNGLTLDGYLNTTLSRFATSDYGSKFKEPNVDFCYYIGYRLPPEHERKYQVNGYWWQTFAARITFVLIFERSVYLIQDLFNMCVSDVPRDVRYKQRRTNFLARRALFDYRMERVQRKIRSSASAKPSQNENHWSLSPASRSTQTDFTQLVPDVVMIPANGSIITSARYQDGVVVLSPELKYVNTFATQDV